MSPRSHHAFTPPFGTPIPDLDGIYQAPTVLVVDDDEWLRGLVAGVLRSSGYDVHEAPTALQALEVLRGPHGDHLGMVLTDVVLPGMNGYALADTIRRDRPTLPVVLMTGRIPSLLPQGDAGMGFGRILQKPFTPETLINVVAERLPRHQSAVAQGPGGPDR